MRPFLTPVSILIFFLEIKLQKEHFSEYSEHFFRDSCASSLNPCFNKNAHAHITTKELKRNGFKLKSEHMKVGTGILVSLTFQINLQMNSF